MATRKETIEFLLKHLHPAERFTVRSMFGEYALYVDAKPVAFVCDDQLFVKVLPPSAELEKLCEKGSPYPGAKPYHLVTEEQWSSIRSLSRILVDIAATLPEPKKKKAKGK